MKNKHLIFVSICIFSGAVLFVWIERVSAATRIVNEDFEDSNYLDTYSHGSYPEAAECVSVAAENGNHYLTGRYDRTDINCRNPHLNIELDRSLPEIYIRYRFRYSPDWNWNGGGHKFWHMAYCSSTCVPGGCEYVHGAPWAWPGFTRSNGGADDPAYAPYDQIRFPGALSTFGQSPNNIGWFDYSVYIKYNNPGDAHNGIFEMRVNNERWSADYSALRNERYDQLQFRNARPEDNCGPSNIELPGNVGGGGQPAPIGSWAIDDIEIWDGLSTPDTTPPAQPTGLTVR